MYSRELSSKSTTDVFKSIHNFGERMSRVRGGGKKKKKENTFSLGTEHLLAGLRENLVF